MMNKIRNYYCLINPDTRRESEPGISNEISAATHSWSFFMEEKTPVTPQKGGRLTHSNPARALAVANGIYSAGRTVKAVAAPLVEEEPTARLHRVFKSYMGVTQENSDIKAALQLYLRRWNIQGLAAENKKIFLDDPDFILHIGTQCDLPRAGAIKGKIQNIVAALLSEVDFSAPLTTTNDNAVAYNGYIFRGLGQMPLADAKQHAERFVTAKIEDYLDVNEHDAAQLAKLVLPALAPEFSLIDSTDPFLSKIHYGDRKWGEIRAGLIIVDSLHNNPEDYTLSELRELGSTFLRERAIAAANDTFEKQESNEISLNEWMLMLMLMANVNGAIDLSKMNVESEENNINQFEKFIANEFKHELAINEARSVLLQPLPVRVDIAERLLREAGEDPQRTIRCEIYDIEGKSTGFYDRSLLDLYMDQGFFQFLARVIPSLEERNKLSRLPDLTKTFNAEFKRYTDNFTRALSKLLQSQMSLSVEHSETTTFKLLQSGIDYISAEDNPILWDATRLYVDVQYTAMGKNVFFVESQHPLGNRTFYIAEGEILKGLQEIPNSQTKEDWIKENLSRVVEEKDLEIMRDTGSRENGPPPGPHTIIGVVKEIKSGNISLIADKAAEYFVREHIVSLKEKAYAASLHEQIEDIFLDFIIPGRSGVKNLNKGNYLDAVIDFGFDIIGFISIGKISNFGKLISYMGNTASFVRDLVRLNINKLTSWGSQSIAQSMMHFRMVSNASIVEQVQKSLINLANEVAHHADGVKAISLMSAGAVCWDAVARLSYKAKLISKSQFDAIGKVRASSYENYIATQRSVTIKTAQDFERLPAGTRIGFFDADNHLKHAMLKLEQGEAIGINNGYLNQAWSGGWKKIDISQSLTWRDNAVFSADGIKLEVRVEI